MDKWTTVLVIGTVLFAAGILASVEPQAQISTVKGSFQIGSIILAPLLIALAGSAAWHVGKILDAPPPTEPIRNAGNRSETLLRRMRFAATLIVLLPIVLLAVDLIVSGKILDGMQAEIGRRLGTTGAAMLIQILLAAYSLVMAILAIDLFMAPIHGLKAKADALVQATSRFVGDAKSDVNRFMTALSCVLNDKTFAEDSGSDSYEAVCDANARLSTLELRLDVLALNGEDVAAMRENVAKTVQSAGVIVEALRFLAHYSSNAKTGGKYLARKILNDQVDIPLQAANMFSGIDELFAAAGYDKPSLSNTWNKPVGDAWPRFKDIVKNIYLPSKP